MGTHYHVFVTTPEPDLAAGMQWLNSRYARWFNHCNDRFGHLHAGRYHSELIESESHAAAVARYIPNNPRRAGICADPATYRWSSYAATLGLAPRPAFLDDEWLL